MKFVLAAPFAILASAVIAAPTAIDPAPAIKVTDTTVLQFALTLEHLEAAFYKTSLAKLSDSHFLSAGHSSFTRDQIEVIASDEQTHADFLQSAIGKDAVAPCKYDFSSVTDVKSFLATAQVLEGVGTSAYLGAAKLISSKAYLQAAASILTVEARHSTYINTAVDRGVPATPAPFDTPLGVTDVYSLAAPFIKSCPKKSDLGIKPFPTLTIKPKGTTGTFRPGKHFTVSFKMPAKAQDGSKIEKLYAAIISGPTSPVFQDITNSNTVLIPEDIAGGQFYVVITSAKSVDDDKTIAGPAIGRINKAFS